MSKHTEKLNLYEIEKEHDTFSTFDIETVLNDNWERIDENVINRNGTVPFIAEQIGVDPTSAQGLTTKNYVDSKIHSSEFTPNAINSGAVDSSGNANVLSYSSNVVTLASATTYTDYLRQAQITSSALNVTIPSTASTTFNLFIEDGALVAYANTIYQQKVIPAVSSNAIWVDTAVEPVVQKKYNGSTWEAYLGVYCGQAVTNSSGNILSIVQPEFNQNGIDINMYTMGYRIPDYAKGVSKSTNTWILAEKDCLVIGILAGGTIGRQTCISLQDENGNFIPSNSGTTGGVSMMQDLITHNAMLISVSAIVPKGYRYNMGLVNGWYSNATLYEYPLRGFDS